MKIAVATDDRINISHHFGSAFGFEIFEIIDNEIVSQEYRENIGKNTGECGSCNHNIMIENIKDCRVIISFGMGKRIYHDLIRNNIQAVVTDEVTIKNAIDRYIKNELKNRLEKLH